MPRTIPNKPTGMTYSLDESVVATIQLFLYSIGGKMITVITILAVALLLWLILKPFILLYIEKENGKYDKER